MLILSERLLLLGLHDEKGSVVSSASMALPYGLAGGLLMELFFTKRLEFSGKNIRVVSSKKLENELLDEALQLIVSSGKQRDASYWLKTIHAKVNNVQQRLTDGLVAKKILTKEEHSFLWVINYSRYPTRDGKPEQDVRTDIKNIVLRGEKATEQDVALLSLVLACELVGEVFDKGDRKKAKKRIEELAKGQQVGKAISQIVEQITVALVVMITTTTVATTVVT